MELDERKTKILQAIIKNYLETGEPVGSRTISKYTDLNLSSATIRNEMADLEELGFIVQPHTSAGRIPSDKGYRFYVDAMMLEHEKEVEQLKDVQWTSLTVAASVFMTIIMMILTYSISLGIAWGFVIYAVTNIASGKASTNTPRQIMILPKMLRPLVMR